MMIARVTCFAAPAIQRTMGLLLAASAAMLCCAGPAAAQSRTSSNDPALARYLKAHPEADTDGDGILTDFEHDGHLPRKVLETLGEDGRHLSEMVAMADGARLATEAFLPSGDGPFATVLIRTPYGRWNTGGYAKRFRGEGVAFVVQDLRGSGDSEGRGTYEPLDFTVEIADSKDTLAWIAAQPWSNGRVGMTGGSGHGMAAALAVWSDAPELVATMPGNTAGHGLRYWLAHNGARRWTYRWATHRGARVSDWPRPTALPLPAADGWFAPTDPPSLEHIPAYSNATGWYDPFCQGALDDFVALSKAGGKPFVTIQPRGHGGVSGREFPRAPMPARAPSLTDVLKGSKAWPDQPTLVYYLMGDATDPDAPGNRYLLTHVWPVPSTPTPLYLTADGALADSPPNVQSELTYRYDPAKPAPSLGGHYAYAAELSGPHDQRPLLSRDDVLHFATPPLDKPLTVVGRLSAELFVKSDAPDTMFVVKLVDIAPSGEAAIIRESATLARFDADAATPTPIQAGSARRLHLDLWSTAYAFNTGHRIGVLVTSSSDPAYEVHPNTFAPVSGPESMRAANNVIVVGPNAPSRVVLPVTAAE